VAKVVFIFGTVMDARTKEPVAYASVVTGVPSVQ
jgi:hypothetical protein